MSNTSTDKFAECSYYWYNTRPKDECNCSGKGQWFDLYSSGSGIVHNDDINGWDGSGWAKGYSPSSNSRPDRCLMRRKY